MLTGQSRHQLCESLPVKLPPEQLQAIQQAVTRVYVSDALLDYCQAIIKFTRNSSEYDCGLSPRAGLALLTAAKAWAFIDQCDAVIPEDLQAVLAAVAGHRLRTGSSQSEAIIAHLSKLAFIVAASQFLYQQSILMAAYILLICCVLLATLVYIKHSIDMKTPWT